MSQTILELIADAIESRPVLGHWPHMRAQADAEYLREISKQWTGLSDEVSALRAEKACRDSERAEDVPTEIRRLRLEPGDILVFKVNPRPTVAMMERMREQLRKMLPSGYPAIILEGSVDMTVVSKPVSGNSDAHPPA
jgi:hypothetical protein